MQDSTAPGDRVAQDRVRRLQAGSQRGAEGAEVVKMDGVAWKNRDAVVGAAADAATLE